MRGEVAGDATGESGKPAARGKADRAANLLATLGTVSLATAIVSGLMIPVIYDRETTPVVYMIGAILLTLLPVAAGLIVPYRLLYGRPSLRRIYSLFGALAVFGYGAVMLAGPDVPRLSGWWALLWVACVPLGAVLFFLSSWRVRGA